ncbi:MAG: ATP-binding cassette domain-containing protein [Firmicutes bacterium]|nr:ATP-binding cassette domain-containing protein [Bacillota bacterium]
MPILATEALSFAYPGGAAALREVNLAIEPGEFVALLGANGSGKTTLLKHCNGLLAPEGGRVLLEGEPIVRDRQAEVLRKVGLVFQDPNDQLFAATVLEDLLFGPLNLGLPSKEAESKARQALKAVGMEGYENKAIHHLSYGQKKRVAIAGVLAMEPGILALDEPTAGLDPAGVEEIMNLLAGLNQRGLTIIMATHDVDLVPEYASRVHVLHRGTIIFNGTPEDLFREGALIRRAGLRLPRIGQVFASLPEKDHPLVERPPFTVRAAREVILELLGRG